MARATTKTEHNTAPRARLTAVAGLLILALSLVGTPIARGWTLLDFPPPVVVQNDNILRQADYVPGQRLTLTYAIDDEFLEGQPLLTQERAIAAIERALDSWSEASNGHIRFVRADYDAVLNTGSTPPAAFVGPAFDDWLEDFLACEGDPACQAALAPPGWGAHIDFFSRPQGWSNTTGGVSYLMTGCNLGFAAVYRDGQTDIPSVDIILSDKWDWTDDETLVTPLRGTQNETAPQLIAAPGAETLTHAPSTTQAGPIAGLPFGERIATTAGVVGFRSGSGGGGYGGGGGTGGGCSGLDLVVDLETVVLHEVGHALGLDHPDEAASNGAAVYDAYLWTALPPNDWSPNDVMYSLYTGVKRELTNDDIGGLAFLYRTQQGDLDADGQITIADAIAAIELESAPERPDPFDTATIDFISRNGFVDIDEVTQVTQWAFAGRSGPYEPNGNRSVEPSEITVSLTNTPEDVGVGGVAALHVTIDNQSAVPINAYEIVISYDDAVFSNPIVILGDYLPGGFALPPSIEPGGVVRLTKLLVAGTDTATQGNIATVLFDINIAAARNAGTYTFSMPTALITTSEPSIHNYGLSDLFPQETLVLEPFTGIALDYDINRDNRLNIEDLYAYGENGGWDVNGDGQQTPSDYYVLRWAVRRGEAMDTQTTPAR